MTKEELEGIITEAEDNRDKAYLEGARYEPIIAALKEDLRKFN